VTARLLETNENGLYCAAGGFYIDPWLPVERAVITHAHADHARPGSSEYLCSSRGAPVLRERLGPDSSITGLAWSEELDLQGVRISFHPAGHILGSSQIRVEHKGEVWVVSGDYKTEPDRTCDSFELVRCNTFVTESTFGLPIYKWLPERDVFAEINAWWASNLAKGRTSVLFAYALGKAQRLLAGVESSLGPIAVHGAVQRFVDVYRAAGVLLPDVMRGDDAGAAKVKGCGLVIAPPSAANSPWLRKFGESSSAFASGWMRVRGIRRRRAADRGFVLSDHADWPSLLHTIEATGAERIEVTHGYVTQLARYLNEHGKSAGALATQYTGDEEMGE